MDPRRHQQRVQVLLRPELQTDGGAQAARAFLPFALGALFLYLTVTYWLLGCVNLRTIRTTRFATRPFLYPWKCTATLGFSRYVVQDYRIAALCLCCTCIMYINAVWVAAPFSACCILILLFDVSLFESTRCKWARLHGSCTASRS